MLTFLSALISHLTPQAPCLHPHNSLRGHSPPACVQVVPPGAPCLLFPPIIPSLSQSQPDSASSWALLSLLLRFALPPLFSHGTIVALTVLQLLDLVFSSPLQSALQDFQVHALAYIPLFHTLLIWSPQPHCEVDIFIFKAQRSCGLGRWNYFPRVTYLASSRAGFWPGG